MERYTGFYIDKPYGNNVFSYEERENKEIFVPKLIEGNLEDVEVGENIVFNINLKIKQSIFLIIIIMHFIFG